MGNGARRKAPCGHLGEVVIGTYVQCARCDKDAAPKHIVPEKTEPMWRPACPGCHSLDIEEFNTDVDAALWFIQHGNAPSAPAMPPQAHEYHCWGCGKVFPTPA